MKREWNNPIIKDLNVEKTENNHYPMHYHCAQCGRVLSDAEFDDIMADRAWNCPSCGSPSYGVPCYKAEHLTIQTS